jgi:hypothetical protein
MSIPDRRAGVFEQALVQGGVNPLAANAATSAILNCATPRRWRGPTTLDYTSPNLRLVTPELRKYQFPNFDFRSSEGERRGPKRDVPEEEVYPEEEPWEEPQNPRPSEPHQQPVDGSGDGQYTAGRYIEIRNGRISVLASRSGVAILDTDRIVGGSIKVKSKWDLARFTEEGDFLDREWVLRVKPTEKLEVVTGVTREDKQLKITTARIDAWVESRSDQAIPFQRVEVTNGGAVGRSGGSLTFSGDAVYYLGAPPEEVAAVFSIPVADCTAGP